MSSVDGPEPTVEAWKMPLSPFDPKLETQINRRTPRTKALRPALTSKYVPLRTAARLRELTPRLQRLRIGSLLLCGLGSLTLAGLAYGAFAKRVTPEANIALAAYQSAATLLPIDAHREPDVVEAAQPQIVDVIPASPVAVVDQTVVAAVEPPAVIEAKTVTEPGALWPVVSQIPEPLIVDQPPTVIEVASVETLPAPPATEAVQVAAIEPPSQIDPPSATIAPEPAPVATAPPVEPAPVQTSALAQPAMVAPPVIDTTCIAPLQTKAKKLRILFATGSSKIEGFDKQQISALVADLSKCPAARVEIAGHTDATGVEYTNYNLSWKRAEEVLKFIGESHDVSRFSAVGYGPREPLVKVKKPKIAKKLDWPESIFSEPDGVSPEEAKRIMAERNLVNRRVEFRVKQ